MTVGAARSAGHSCFRVKEQGISFHKSGCIGAETPQVSRAGLVVLKRDEGTALSQVPVVQGDLRVLPRDADANVEHGGMSGLPGEGFRRAASSFSGFRGNSLFLQSPEDR